MVIGVGLRPKRESTRYTHNHQPLKTNPPTIGVDLFPRHGSPWGCRNSATCASLVPIIGGKVDDQLAHVWCRGFSTTACVSVVPTNCENETRVVHVGFDTLEIRGCFLLGGRQTNETLFLKLIYFYLSRHNGLWRWLMTHSK